MNVSKYLYDHYSTVAPYQALEGLDDERQCRQCDRRLTFFQTTYCKPCQVRIDSGQENPTYLMAPQEYLAHRENLDPRGWTGKGVSGGLHSDIIDACRAGLITMAQVSQETGELFKKSFGCKAYRVLWARPGGQLPLFTGR